MRLRPLRRRHARLHRRVHAPGAGTGEDQVEKHEAEQHRRFAEVLHRNRTCGREPDCAVVMWRIRIPIYFKSNDPHRVVVVYPHTMDIGSLCQVATAENGGCSCDLQRSERRRGALIYSQLSELFIVNQAAARRADLRWSSPEKCVPRPSS